VNISLRSPCFPDEAFFVVEKQNLQFWDYVPQVLDCQDF